MKKKVDIEILNQAIGLKKAGKSQREIAKELNISKSCVQNAIVRHEERGTLVHKSGGGRKRVTTVREDRSIARIATQNKTKPLSAIHADVKQSDIDLSISTLCRRMKEMGFESRAKVKKQLLTKKHRVKRLEWCKKYRNWTVRDHQKYIMVRSIPSAILM